MDARWTDHDCWPWQLLFETVVILEGFAPLIRPPLLRLLKSSSSCTPPLAVGPHVAAKVGAARNRSTLIAFAPYGRATIVMSRAERYRELARECLRLANLLLPRPQRDRAREMAYE
jgi:hypothetical protein